MNTAPAPKTRILVVDRSDDLLDVFSYFLEYRGFEVRTSNNGATGLTCASEFAPDAVFSSLRVGQLDGFSLARELRKLPQTANSVLVAMSAYGHESPQEHEAGFDHYLTKPIAFEALMAILEPLDARGLPRSNVQVLDKK